MRGLIEAATLIALAIAAGVGVSVWLGFMAGIAINVARWFL